MGSDEFCASLVGESVETRACDGGKGRDFFSQWSPCSTTCGTGQQTRTISNTCTSEVGYESQVCTNNAGFYGAWSSWTACSATCGGGFQTRSKQHSCGREDYVQERTCNENAGYYEQWSEWSDCPVSCGGGNVVRQRVHSCTGEIQTDSKFCNTHPCSYYGAWSNWSPCSASCGIGTMSRMRYCHGGRVGDGLCIAGDVTTNEVAQCQMGDCCDFDWSGWTGCCRNTRNQNVRLRFRGGCAGSPAEEVSKPCDKSGIVSDTCMVVIQNSYELGLLTGGYNSTYVINPDEFYNFQNQIVEGVRLGHDDFGATDHSLDTRYYTAGTTYNTGTVSNTGFTGNTGTTYTTYQQPTVYNTGTATGTDFTGVITGTQTGPDGVVVQGTWVNGVFVPNSNDVATQWVSTNGNTAWQTMTHDDATHSHDQMIN